MIISAERYRVLFVCSALTVFWGKNEMQICWIQSNWHLNLKYSWLVIIQES